MMKPQNPTFTGERDRKRSIKCVVWDLDNTLWQGILLEDASVRLRSGVAEVIKTLDERGILHSIASRNDHDQAMEKLREFDLQQYFLHPQINWNSKSSSIEAIAAALNLGLDAFAFVDDDAFEREEVSFSHPAVLCLDAADSHRILELPELMPGVITDDSRRRRLMYLSDIERKKAEEEFAGPNEEFLATLEMVFSIRPAQPGDLERAEELTVRTHQLNSTGRTYSLQELEQFSQSNRHQLLIASLEDKFGSYGKIGLALIECAADIWTIKLLLMSCRVVSRGVGTVMLGYIMEQAQQAKAMLRAEFAPNDRNRIMYITYKFAGFKEIEKSENLKILEADLAQLRPRPAYIKLL
ncbi:MAG: HAD-IIIC family phosphatase [Acidobacteriota bacterium]